MTDTIDDRTQQESAFYDDMWRKYGALDAVSPAAFHRRRIIARLAGRACQGATEPLLDVLDVGCGQGDLLYELSKAIPGARLHGADISQASLDETRRKNPGCDVFLLDVTAPELPPEHRDRLGRYDLVVCSEVIEHLEHDTAGAHRLLELVRPGGALIVTVPGGKPSRFDLAIGHKRHYDRQRLRGLLEGAGFRVERVLAWGFPFHSLYRTAVRLASGLSMRQSASGADSDHQPRRGFGDVLAKAYVVFGAALKPLFYLNLSQGGEQMLALARRPREP